MKLSVSPIQVLIGICLLDLISTLYVLAFGGAEGNPLMGSILAYGLAVFIAAKLAFVFIPVAILKWARRHRPVFVHWSTWIAVVAYLALYCSGSIHANTRQQVPASYAGLADIQDGMSPELVRRLMSTSSSLPAGY